MRLVRIPRALLHIDLDDLSTLGISDAARQALRSLVADLPLVPLAQSSAQLIGPSAVTLPSLVVVARHVGQGLRDTNLAIAADRQRLRADRRKLIFLSSTELRAVLRRGDECRIDAAALFITEVRLPDDEPLLPVLRDRESAGLVTFITSLTAVSEFSYWRIIDLAAPA